MRFNIRSILSTVTAVVALMAVQSAAFAHFIWATVDKGEVRFALLENAGEAPNTQFAKYVEKLTPRSGNKTLPLGETKEGARYAKVPAGQGVVTAESVVGARERGGKPYLLVYHAKGAVSLAAAGTLTKAPAELVARREGKELIVSLRQNGTAVAETEVWVQWPGGEEESSGKTDKQGDVHVPWNTEVSKSGFVGIRAMVTEDKAGEQEGKSYASIHRWATLTFPLEASKVGGPKTAALPGEEKPLTQILREAYGKNHDIVGNAAFNQTLFAGKLTREQLETHLQQRALIHNEVHRILNAAAQKGNVPYGAAQKNVLVLLFQDLIAMGSGWPTEPQARPLTRAFLQDIRDSEKRGPYFALGVQHIYYGGITNGGRLIGKKIGDTLQFQPTYYEKSDGYRAYLTEVNKITDPAAQQEMIRGGQEAYKYIIDSSNEDIFKAKEAQQ
jgi:hypothetical protein